MKRVVCMVFSLALLLSLAACSSPAQDDSSAAEPTKDFSLYLSFAHENWCEVAKDLTWIKIDTNPYDIKDHFEPSAFEVIPAINRDLSIPSVVFEEMKETRSLDGRQKYQGDTYSASWSYHPDNGLEVTYSYDPASASEAHLSGLRANSELSEADAKLYNSVLNSLAADFEGDNYSVMWECADAAGLSYQQLDEFMSDALKRVCLGTPDDSSLPIKYPATSYSPYLENAVPPPAKIYNTTAEENGLAGTVYCITGTVKSYETAVLDGIETTMFYLSTDDGDILVNDIYNYTKAMFPEDFVEEEGSDYSLPPVGSYIKLYCVYGGFSMRVNMPSVYYGAPDWFVESFDD